MADYAFFLMGMYAIIVLLVISAGCVATVVACVVAARVSPKPRSGLIAFILLVGSVPTCGLTAVPALVFAVRGFRQKPYRKLCWVALAGSLAVVVLGGITLAGFFSTPAGRLERMADIGSGALIPYQAALEVDRTALGLPPLPQAGQVQIVEIDRVHWKWEYPPPNYDVVLCFYESSPDSMHYHTTRAIAIKRNDGELKWVGEQMTFQGPKTQTTFDGTINEQITLTCENGENIFRNTNRTDTLIKYSGPDARLTTHVDEPNGLTISKIAPILREWGYAYSLAESPQQDEQGVR